MPFSDDIEDINASLQDNYFSNDLLILTRDISKNGTNESYTNPNPQEDDPFSAFSQIGFWEVGAYSITYSAEDGCFGTRFPESGNYC